MEMAIVFFFYDGSGEVGVKGTLRARHTAGPGARERRRAGFGLG
jgi:hypothetical protein